MVWLHMGMSYFIIAILGCGEGDAACQQVRMLDTHYQSQAACAQATEAVLPSQTDVDFPVVVAQCVAAGAPSPDVNAGDVTRPGAGDAGLRTSPVRNRS